MEVEITPRIVQNLLDYYPETGELIWRRRSQQFFPNEQSAKSWNTRYSGTVAGSKMTSIKDSYSCIVISITVGGRSKNYRAHRLAWMHYYGENPLGPIDHINRNAHDNRIANLRLASPGVNEWNRNISSRNSSGIVNVYWEKKYNKWFGKCSQIGHRSSKFLGYFDDKIDAARAVAKFRKEDGQPMHNHSQYIDD